MKTICKITFILTSIVCFSLTSCGGDDSTVFGSGGGGGGGGDNSDLVNILMSKKWYYSTSDIDEYSYGWAQYTQTWTYYFIDDKNCICYWTTKDNDSDLGTSKNSGVNEYTYTVSGNTVSLSSGTTFTYSDGYLIDDDEYFQGLGLDSDDYSKIVEWRDQMSYDDVIDDTNNFSTKITETDKYHKKLTVKSSLSSIYPGKKIKFWIIFNTYYKGKWEEYDRFSVDLSSSSSTSDGFIVDNLYAMLDSYSLYLSIVEELIQKKQLGESLSPDEEDLYKDSKKILDEKISDYSFDYMLEIGDKEYEVYPDKIQMTSATGDGSLTNPFTVVGAAQEAGKLAVGEISTNNYYIKGKISSIKYTFSEQYGVATFHIYDGVTKTNQFYIYGTKYLGNRNWITGDTQIKIGDEVIIYGKLTNYNGILETADRENYIYSLNGKIN